ncbi:prolyl endopeptidase [alpha proteobacterium U9-1i]|nr:prolyl endopeptidase [alpha proteobacterium U9-1i]
MRNLCCTGLALLLSVIAAIPSALAQTAPATRREAVTNTTHGIVVDDPYRWLEQAGTPEVEAWAAAQNVAAERYAGADVATREGRLLQYANQISARGARMVSGQMMFMRGWIGSAYQGLYVGDPEGEARYLDGPIIDLNDPSRSATETTVNFWPSPDGRLVLSLTAPQGSNWSELRLIDVASGRVISRRADVHRSFSSADWLADGTGYVYAAYHSQDGAPARGHIVLVTLTGEEREVFSAIADGDDRQRLLSPRMAFDRSSRLFVEATSGTSGTSDLYIVDLRQTGPPRNLSQGGGTWLFLGARDDSAWVFTNEGAPNGRVVRVDRLSRTVPTMRTIIAEGPGAIAAGSQVGGNVYGMFGNRIALLYRENAIPTMRLFDLNGRLRSSYEIPPTGSVWSNSGGGMKGDPRRAEAYYQFLGASEPASIYRLDLNAGRATLVSAARSAVDRDDIVAERRFVERPDGARVPIIIAHRRGLDLSQPHRLMMYGYGAFGWVSFLWYQPHVIDMLMHDDGVFVVAGVRGGGEFGTAWHEAGRGRNRQVAIDDYNASAEYLIAQGYTTPNLLVANTSSIAGSLVGAAVNQRPELYGALVLDYSVLDLARFSEFGHARYWVDELGSPADPDALRWLMAISPYHNIGASGRCLPPTLIRVGPNDRTVPPFHGYKYAAARQNQSGCDTPVFLDVMEGAGHNTGSTPQEIAHSDAVELEFIARVLSPSN